MAWQDRDYNDGGSRSDYFSNPALFLNFSVPFGTWFGARVRLHFWLLLTILFVYAEGFHFGNVGLVFSTAYTLLLIASVLIHEFGHRYFARAVGGWHEEFMLWPFGGWIPPRAPPYPWPTFIANAGGMIMNLLLLILCSVCLYFVAHMLPAPSRTWLAVAIGAADPSVAAFANSSMAHGWAAYALITLSAIQIGILMINLLPFYWFDGGPLLQAILTPWTGLFQAINVTCIVGMCIAAPMFFLSLYNINFWGMIWWVFLFAGSFTKRRELRATGTGEFDDQIAFSAQAALHGAGEYAPTKRRKPSRWPSRSAVKVAAEKRRREEHIDAILDKVRAKGMQSLNYFERRALRKATEDQKRKEQSRRGA